MRVCVDSICWWVDVVGVAVLSSRLAFALSTWEDNDAFVEIEKSKRGREEV